MDLTDVILTVVYFGLILLIGKGIVSQNKNKPVYEKYFVYGLAAKLGGALGFCLIYTYYYEYEADSQGYFRDTGKLVDSLQYGLHIFYEVINRETINVESQSLDYINRMTYRAPMEYYVVHLTAPFYILGFGNYFSTSLVIAFFSYWGVWYMFLLMLKIYPHLEKQMAFCILFIPSVVFWSSGVSKEGFIICFMGLIIYHFDLLTRKSWIKISSILIVVTATFLVFKIKAYVIVALVPAMLVWKTLYLRDRINNGFIRLLTLPVFAVVGVVVMINALTILGQYNEKYSTEAFVSTAQSMQGWHYVEGHNTAEEYGRGSSYSLGVYEPTPSGLLKIFPAAVNVTLFRPYLWEARSPVVILQALESLAFLLITIYISLKAGILQTYRIVTRDSFLLMCLIFSIIFAFSVGFSAYNFGALSRYKVPCIPFYAVALFATYHNYRKKQRFKYTEKRVRPKLAYRPIP